MTSTSLRFPIHSKDCGDSIIRFVVGGYKRTVLSQVPPPEEEPVTQQEEEVPVSTSPVPSATTTFTHVDGVELTKRQYVLELARRFNLTRRELAKRADLKPDDFRLMNYWLRGKEMTQPDVERVGSSVYQWAVAFDSRIGIPMSQEEKDLAAQKMKMSNSKPKA
jgi:hypothetical protein